MSDGKITIDAEVSAKRAEAQLLALENKMTKLADKIKGLKAQRNILPTDEFAKASKRYDEAAAGMDRWTEKMYKLSKAGKENSAEFKKAENAADGYEAACERAEEQMTALKEAGKQFQGPGDAGYDEMTSQIAQAEAELAYMGAKWDQTNEGMKTSSAETGSSVKTNLAGAATAILNAYTNMCQVMVKGFQTMYKWVSKVAGVLKGALTKAVGSLVSGFRNIFTGGKSASSAISDFNKRLLSLVKAAFVFNVIRKALSAVTSGIGDAVKSFATYNGELNANISNLQTALAGLQGAFASAFTPIINAVVPMLVTLINYITSAVNALGMFFAALSGKTSYTKLIANQQNYAGALNDTSKAAKAAANNLAKFDDLDVLSKDSSSGGSGGSGSGSDWGGTEEVPISSELAEMFKNGDYFDFGYAIADKIADALEQIPWDTIREKALEMGTTLAEILNGVFANLRFATDLGITLAQGINTALDFLYGFITSFDWTQFGVWWGYLFNAFVQQMDWNLLAETITGGINGLVASIQAFFTTIYSTMQQLGSDLASGVQSIFQGINWTGISDTILMGLTDLTALINGWNLEINWEENANALLNGVNELAQGMVMDPNGTIHQVWAENGTSVGVAIQNFLNGCHEFVTGFPFEQFTDSLSKWFQSAIAAIDWNEAGDTINKLITGLIDSVTQFLTENQPDMVQAICDFIDGLDLTSITGSIFDLVGELLNIFTQTIQEMDWEDLGVLILSAIAIGLITMNPLIAAVAAITLLLAELLLKLISDIIDWCTSGAQKICEVVSAWLSGILNIVNTYCNGILTFITNILNSIKETWDRIWNAISDAFSAILDVISDTVWTSLDSILQTIADVLNIISDTWQEIWNAISDLVMDILNGIFDFIGDIFGSIDECIEDTLDAIDTKWGDIWRGMKDTLKGVINGIIGFINSMISGVESGINYVIDLVNGMKFDIPDIVPVVGGTTFGFNVNHVSVGRIPTLANGGITTGATLAQIGEAGREAVLPLEANTDWMDELAGRIADVIDSRGASGINTVTMELNGQELARVALDDLVSEIGRRGLTVDTVFA